MQFVLGGLSDDGRGKVMKVDKLAAAMKERVSNRVIRILCLVRFIEY